MSFTSFVPKLIDNQRTKIVEIWDALKSYQYVKQIKSFMRKTDADFVNRLPQYREFELSQ